MKRETESGLAAVRPLWGVLTWHSKPKFQVRGSMSVHRRKYRGYGGMFHRHMFGYPANGDLCIRFRGRRGRGVHVPRRVVEGHRRELYERSVTTGNISAMQ